jgi:hypothetical protein
VVAALNTAVHLPLFLLLLTGGFYTRYNRTRTFDSNSEKGSVSFQAYNRCIFGKAPVGREHRHLTI